LNADDLFEKYCNEMLDKFLERNPDFGTYLGLHDPYDYLLPEGSTERLLGNLHWLNAFITQLNETMNKDDLSVGHRIDWEVIEKAYELSKFSFYKQRMHELNPDATEDIGGLIFVMFARNYAPLEKRVDAIAARIEKTPKFLEEFHSRFNVIPPVKLWTELAIEKIQNIGGLFMFILHSTKGKVSNEVYERLTKAVEALQPALKAHIDWLHSLLPKTKEKWAIGRIKFEELIQLRDLGMNSEEIYRIGVNYLKKLKSEREELAHQIAPGKSVEEVLKMVESNAPKTFEDGLEFTRTIMEKARDFVQEKHIATVYPEDILLVEETPAFLTPVIPFAALIMPAKFDKPQIGIYLVTKPNNPANLGKQLNYSSLKLIAVHEAYPGHFLQGAISNRGSFVRLLARGTEITEGWAFYCEEMMAEVGFITDLETRLMQVNEMIWRAVRIVLDVKLSRGEMTFDDAVKILVEETGMSEDAAKAEVNWYTQEPGYPLSYLLGKHLLLKLKEEVQQQMGDQFDERFFNDTITANGYLPISLLRQVFTSNQHLTS
jgi:uncharacterized protein (DUF885 family)